MKRTFVALILLTAVIVISCSKKNHASKTAMHAPAATYTANVKSIIQAKCSPCHIPADGGNKKALDTYLSVKENLDDILHRIQLAPTERGFMPRKKDPLPAEEIAMFKKWKEEGAAE